MPTSQRFQVEAPSRYTVACLALCASILLIAGVDLAHTQSRLPDASTPACQASDVACFDAERTAQLERERAADPLQDQYDSRAWLYVSAILAIAAVATAFGMRANPRTEWPRIFTNLGVIGVWLGIGAVIALVATDDEPVTVPAAPALMLPVVLLGAATTGTLIGRSEGWAQQSQVDGVRRRVVHLGKLAIHVGTVGQVKRSRMEELARLLSYTALGLTALTCLLALVSVLAQPDCSTSTSPPGWTDAVDAIVAVTAVAAVAAGIGALLLRRWIVALTSISLCPLTLLIVLASTCAFY